MVHWKEEYVIGVEQIDEQHKKLIEIANKVYELLRNDFLTDKYDRIVEVIEELANYTVFHFKSEEEYMLSIGYKKFLSHKVEHDEFIEKINSFDLSQIDESQEKHLIDILNFIITWIDEHIIRKDKLINA